MTQPGMRITLDAAMRARDVSPPRLETPAALVEPVTEQATAKPRKGERRRLGKRAAQARTAEGQGSGGSSPVSS
ncbi:MAG: hypothetical protein JWN00_3056 [Actinomycetia bacterium]|nr:hypothetical protein [Actinomycetes bacterium]